MSNRKIRAVVFLAVVSIIGIVITQAYWIDLAFDQKEKEFHRDVNMVLNTIAIEFSKYSDTSIPSQNPIRQLSGNYYVVMVNGPIDANFLDLMLKSGFEQKKLQIDYEYGIYDCTTNCMVYGEYVNGNNQASITPLLPVWDDADYYFGVHFPTKRNYLVGKMDVWIYSTIVLLAVIIFFGYSMTVILKQKRLSEIQKDFIDNVTHEFKTPLSTLEVAADVLKKKDIIYDPDRLGKYSNIVSEETDRLKKQVENLLQLKSLQSSKQLIRKEPVSIHDLLESIYSQISKSLQKGKLILNLKAGKPMVEVDKEHLKNSFYVLIDNAIKYSDNVPEVILSTENTKKGVKVSIHDNGIGIPEKYQKKIFERFFRVPKGNIHNVSGFGIGLSYVWDVIASHGGKVSVDSNPGKGSVFTIILPQ